MNQEQSVLLESILLSSIEQAIKLDNPSFISLIKIAKEKNLFFPELYQTFFMQTLHQSYFWEYDYVLENLEVFGQNLHTAGTAYSEVWQYQTSIILKIADISKELPNEKLISALKFGIILPEDFFTHPALLTYISDDNVKVLKRLNRTNINKYQKNLEPTTSIIDITENDITS
jgi:hypothetical protein